VLVEERNAIALRAPLAPPVALTTEGPRGVRVAEAYHGAAPDLAVFAVDAIAIGVASALAGGSRVAMVAAAAFLFVGGLTRLYDRRTAVDAQGAAWFLRRLPLPLLAVCGALVIVGHSRSELLVQTAAVAIAVSVPRGLVWMGIARSRRRQHGLHAALAVGVASRTSELVRRLEAFPEAGLQVAATYAPATANGERARIRALLQSGAVTQILIAAESHDEALVQELVRWTGGHAVDIAIVLPVGARATGMARIGDLGVVTIARTGQRPRVLWAKRSFDVLASALLLLLLAPALAAVSLAIYLCDRGPVIYRQRRVGLDNREFTIWKFRSMVPGADHLTDHYASANMASGLLFKLPDDPRVTPVGELIRRLSIDELPQLVNVLKGDMSLVGPRPLPVEPEEFDPDAARRHSVRPGITGPWQVAGGHVLGYDDMIKLDLAYVDGWSLRRDLWYLAMTIPAVIVRRSMY
jgi:exopolysaccharide biosynthesis polyprenyl glycosylphosphotransferase